MKIRYLIPCPTRKTKLIYSNMTFRGSQMEERIFKLIKDEILKLRDEGQVLQTF